MPLAQALKLSDTAIAPAPIFQGRNESWQEEIDANIDQAKAALKAVGSFDPGDLDSTLADVENTLREKRDWALPEPLLVKSFASISLDISTAVFFCPETVRELN